MNTIWNKMANKSLYVIIPIILISCSTVASSKVYLSRVNNFTENIYVSAKDLFPRDRYSSVEELISYQGKPDKLTEIPDWPKTREGDYWIEIEYQNKYLQYYYSSLSKTYLVRSIRFFSNDWEYKYGIRIGMTEEELMRILGKKNKRKQFEHQIEIGYYPENKTKQIGFFFSYQGILEEIEIKNNAEEN